MSPSGRPATRLSCSSAPDAVGWNPSSESINGQFADHGHPGTDFAIKQAYVALRTPVGNGIDWKIGRLIAIIGYESFAAGNDPNFTRSGVCHRTDTTHRHPRHLPLL